MKEALRRDTPKRNQQGGRDGWNGEENEGGGGGERETETKK